MARFALSDGPLRPPAHTPYMPLYAVKRRNGYVHGGINRPFPLIPNGCTADPRRGGEEVCDSVRSHTRKPHCIDSPDGKGAAFPVSTVR